jgi:hypothetical protein
VGFTIESFHTLGKTEVVKDMLKIIERDAAKAYVEFFKKSCRTPSIPESLSFSMHNNLIFTSEDEIYSVKLRNL